MLSSKEACNARNAVYEELSELLGNRLNGHPIADDLNLNADLGLTSLELADLVALLERRLERDPFRTEVAITEVRTVGDLCNAYIGTSAGNRGADSLLAKIRERALSRHRDTSED